MISPEKHQHHQQRIWRRILYEAQNYPDNYVDTNKFLENLLFDRTSGNVSYVQLLIECSAIVHQINFLSIFLTIFKFLINGTISTYSLLIIR